MAARASTELRQVEERLRAGDIAGAQAALSAAAQHAHDPLAFLVLQGQVHAAAGRFDRALSSFLAATRRDPHHAAAFAGMGDALVMLGELETALLCFRRALAARPGDPRLVTGVAWVEVRLGRAEAARARLEPLLQAGASPSTLAVWGTASLHVGAAEEVVRVLEPALERLPRGRDRATLGHVLGDCHDRLGRWPEAFSTYARANRDQPAPPYDPDEHTRYVERLAEVFGGERGRSLPALEDDPADRDEPRHVLIVGMPRSGTSLVEQILGRHPGVHACGELSTLGRLATTLPQRLGVSGDFTDVCSQMTIDSLRSLRMDYDRHLSGAPPGARCMSDKMPENYMWLGFARCFMRGLRVVHCVRDPLDTCWSAFTKNFGVRLRYSNDLEWLGRRYRDHLRLVDALSPPLASALLQVPYECLVSDPETWVRALLEHCGLPFDAACLHPEQSTRRVATASYAQVREPIHRGSVGRAQPYASWLGPLRAALA